MFISFIIKISSYLQLLSDTMSENFDEEKWNAFIEEMVNSVESDSVSITSSPLQVKTSDDSKWDDDLKWVEKFIEDLQHSAVEQPNVNLPERSFSDIFETPSESSFKLTESVSFGEILRVNSSESSSKSSMTWSISFGEISGVKSGTPSLSDELQMERTTSTESFTLSEIHQCLPDSRSDSQPGLVELGRILSSMECKKSSHSNRVMTRSQLKRTVSDSVVLPKRKQRNGKSSL